MDVPTNLPHNTWTPGAARGFCTLDPSLRLTQGNDQKETLKERWKRGAKHSMRVALSSKMLGGLADDLKVRDSLLLLILLLLLLILLRILLILVLTLDY